MPVTPAWQAPTAGFAANAGAVNQLLGTHAIDYVYTGVEQASQTALGSGSTASDSLWIAQSFTTTSAQTTTGYVLLAAAVTGSPAPWTVSLQASSGGAPSGTPLASAAFPKEFANASFTFRFIPLPASGLTASTTYWIVTQAVGDASDYFSWNRSNQTSGASTSTNGTSWTSQSYGLLYQAWDGSAVPPLAGTFEDSGARWTSLTYTSGLLTGLKEYTSGQAANGYTASSRTLSWADGAVLAGVA